MNAVSQGCQVLNLNSARDGERCEAPLDRMVMQNGLRHVCWTHGHAHDAGRVLSFADDAPVLAEAVNG